MEKDEIRQHDSFQAFDEIRSILNSIGKNRYFFYFLIAIYIPIFHEIFYFGQEEEGISRKVQYALVCIWYWVDFLLLSGHLFHENKPWRSTSVRGHSDSSPSLP